MKSLNQRFLALADAVSFGMGTPTNIFFWILAVVVWFWLGYSQHSLFEDGNFLPAWFTSTSWNFPLNTITTLAELYIGFLVAAAANRSERDLRHLIQGMKTTVEKVEHINKRQDEVLELLLKYQEKEIKKENTVIREISKLNG